MVLVKFWLHISQKEQLRRFRARDRDPLKRWKLTGEDWRNLSKRSEYERAVADMLRETDHDHAPWRLIAAENKPYARVAVLREVIEAYEQGMRDSGHEPVDVAAALQSQRFAADRLGSPQPRRLLRPQKLFKQESRRHRRGRRSRTFVTRRYRERHIGGERRSGGMLFFEGSWRRQHRRSGVPPSARAPRGQPSCGPTSAETMASKPESDCRRYACAKRSGQRRAAPGGAAWRVSSRRGIRL
jgi:hypothetical protein